MPDRPETIARRFQALSVGTRIRILCMLRNRALCVGAIAARLDITQGAVSQHLRVLREAGLVRAERRGYHVHYQVHDGALEACRGALHRVLQGKPQRRQSQKGDHPCVQARKAVRNPRS